MKDLKEIFYWNKYKVIPNKNEVGTNDNSNSIRELLDGSYQENKRFFVLIMIILKVTITFLLIL